MGAGVRMRGTQVFWVRVCWRTDSVGWEGLGVTVFHVQTFSLEK